MPETQNIQPTDTKPETAETKVRRVLKEHPGTTAAKLASAAGVGRSTATKILSRWSAEGLVTRTTGKDQSVPVTWTMCDEQNDDDASEVAATGEDVPTAAEQGISPVAASDASTASAPTTSGDPTADTPKKERLSKGALYELVRGFLQEHPGEEFGPAKIGCELTRSSGAVNNALEKLVTNGLATKTCEAPKRFTSS